MTIRSGEPLALVLRTQLRASCTCRARCPLTSVLALLSQSSQSHGQMDWWRHTQEGELGAMAFGRVELCLWSGALSLEGPEVRAGL